jgi:hypothetical protein
VPLVAAAVCPHPPLLVPEVAAGAAAEVAGLLAAADQAVAHLLASGADTVVVVGGGPRTRHVGGGRGDFARWGAPQVRFAFGDTALPELSLLIGGWLLARHDLGGRAAVFTAVADTAPAADCAALGRTLAAAAQRVALLVMGDGSACHGPKAPGYDDPRAPGYHKDVAGALAAADPAALLALDPAGSTDLKVAGRAAWQVLAGAAGDRWRGAVHYDAAPYGVGYLVATWSAA